MTIATVRMQCSSLQPNQTVLSWGSGPDATVLPIEPGGWCEVPYPLVRAAMGLNWATSAPWPPSPGLMSPPEPFSDDQEAVAMPDGTEVPLPRPHGQTLKVPMQHVQALEALGWCRLAQFA